MTAADRGKLDSYLTRSEVDLLAKLITEQAEEG
jgi:hypothetical protein